MLHGGVRLKSWWAYMPDVCEAGVVFDAATLEEAERIASDMLRSVEWDTAYIEGARRRQLFYIYQLGDLTLHYLPEEEE